MIIDTLIDFIPPTTAFGAGFLLFVYLLKRGDVRDQGAFKELKDVVKELKSQRDYWREKAEDHESHIHELQERIHELERTDG